MFGPVTQLNWSRFYPKYNLFFGLEFTFSYNSLAHDLDIYVVHRWNFFGWVFRPLKYKCCKTSGLYVPIRSITCFSNFWWFLALKYFQAQVIISEKWMFYGNKNDNLIALKYFQVYLAHCDLVNYCSVTYNLKWFFSNQCKYNC